MQKLANHLQVNIDNRLLIYDLNLPDPRPVFELDHSEKLFDPENFVESELKLKCYKAFQDANNNKVTCKLELLKSRLGNLVYSLVDGNVQRIYRKHTAFDF